MKPERASAQSAPSVSTRLPDFPWDKLTAHAATARAHPDGIVDLSVGTPVDPTPEVVQAALCAAADAPGYPTTLGLEATRQAAIDWLARRFGVTGLGLDGVLPVIGSKELIASMALHLGVGAGDLIGYPALAYPTYEVGAALAGARAMATDSLTSFGPETPKLLWLNSPSNPTGRVLPIDHLRKVVDWCRERGTILVSDECYLELAWDAAPGSGPISVLHPDVCGGSHEGILSVHSLSKRSNLAGYRCAFVAGDPALVGELLAVRKNLGLQMPAPQQRAMIAALEDDAHVVEQHATYAARRARLRTALEGAGFTIDHSEGSLYLWATRDEACWDTVQWFADLGILVAPGEFYGAAGRRHVRVAFTASDERVTAAVERLPS
ncbi:succinyldiaminopimelate transaminase [Nocardioides sp.]|uniref:succinyldiaminopimelate transaminase n=1 Tax=Nocardioides sp. TaxID=35761 RepID=UPI002CDD5F0A|nr:succinyldiaminopimelate transaminase [Nocardioides sp.]HXH81229.1 succinyldiaminopimelate transaminase [Nocardioides sp.]